MQSKWKPLCTAAVLLLTGCTRVSGEQLAPLMGLEWFQDYDNVKAELAHYTLLDERECEEKQGKQKMQDYSDVELFDYVCDLTLCFTDSGLIGFNYHDVAYSQNYNEWYSTLEKTYGLPTEQGSGMASWYDNPAGKDTAIYLFNLEEGVQISIYATADSPDKSYKKQKNPYTPTPEIRTPIVPVVDESTSAQTKTSATDTSSEAASTLAAHALREEKEGLYTNENGILIPDLPVTDAEGNTVTDIEHAEMTSVPAATNRTAASTAARPLTTETVTVPAVPTEPETEPETASDSLTDAFLLNGLQFYGSSDSERRKMNSYTQLYEYRTEEPGQPWELIMEYENVPYLGKNCDAVLCFTSLGLVGINYFDSNTGNYSHWVQTLTDIYGSADEVQYDYTAWSSSPAGAGTMIYVFALEDGVQISFFADDTGSELA